MNSRIQELADKIWAEEYWSNPNTDKLLPAQLNKFAELIVKECADTVLGFHNQFGDSAHNEIREHFGVEQ